MFDLILFSLTFLDQQVFVIIVPYRLRGLFGIFGKYNDLRELGVCKVCRRHARLCGMKGIFVLRYFRMIRLSCLWEMLRQGGS